MIIIDNTNHIVYHTNRWYISVPRGEIRWDLSVNNTVTLQQIYCSNSPGASDGMNNPRGDYPQIELKKRKIHILRFLNLSTLAKIMHKLCICLLFLCMFTSD